MLRLGSGYVIRGTVWVRAWGLVLRLGPGIELDVTLLGLLSGIGLGV